jgi:hypothetical protein
MSSSQSNALAEFERFLIKEHFVLQTRFEDEGHFGNTVIAYANSTIRVRLILDRSVWSILVAAVSCHAVDAGYDMHLIRDMLTGVQTDTMSISGQIEFFELSLPQIICRFSADELQGTIARLNNLGKQRVQRLFPGLEL